MTLIDMPPLPRIAGLPHSMPDEGAISIELVEGVPIFRASPPVQERVELLLEKLPVDGLTHEETAELDLYQDIDDYLSYLNRLIRNITLAVHP